jgi:hypothetical protein
MMGPLGGATDESGSDHHLADLDVNGGPPGGSTDESNSNQHLVDEDVDGGPLGVLPVDPAAITT